MIFLFLQIESQVMFILPFLHDGSSNDSLQLISFRLSLAPTLGPTGNIGFKTADRQGRTDSWQRPELIGTVRVEGEGREGSWSISWCKIGRQESLQAGEGFFNFGRSFVRSNVIFNLLQTIYIWKGVWIVHELPYGKVMNDWLRCENVW